MAVILKRSVAAVLIALGCGDDGSGGPRADAGPCGDEFEYQVEVYDWNTDLPALPVTVTDVLDSNRSTTSAPNGRAVLCLERGSDTTLLIESDSHIDKLETVHPQSYGDYLADSSALAYRVYLFDSAALSEIIGGTSITGTSQVVLEARRGDSPAPGAIPLLNTGSDDLQIGTRGQSFQSGTATTDEAPFAVFPNAEVPATGSVALDVEGTECSFPDRLELRADTLTAALVHCPSS